jgi:hypothetical protein
MKQTARNALGSALTAQNMFILKTKNWKELFFVHTHNVKKGGRGGGDKALSGSTTRGSVGQFVR